MKTCTAVAIFLTTGSAFVLLALGALLCSLPVALAAGQGVAAPHPMVVTLDPAIKVYARVLGGPPSTHSMRSGHVVPAPGDSVGRHTTGWNEEVVVVFEGEGKMTITGGPELALGPGSVPYCPANTEHDVTNTGTQSLRYLYVVAAVPAMKKE